MRNLDWYDPQEEVQRFLNEACPPKNQEFNLKPDQKKIDSMLVKQHIRGKKIQTQLDRTDAIELCINIGEECKTIKEFISRLKILLSKESEPF